MKPRVSIRGLLAAVVFIAIATAALRSASRLWASASFTAMLGVLATAVLGACFAGRQRRPFWVGFALFGWGYMLLALGPWFSEHAGPGLLTTNVFEQLFHRMNPDLSVSTSLNGASLFRIYHRNDPARPGQFISIRPEDFQRTAHSLFALLAALSGGIIACAFAARSESHGSPSS